MGGDGEKKFILIAIVTGVVCLTILYVFLFVSLWDYKEWVGGSLLALIVAPVVVYLCGRLNEQALRRNRYRHHEETPLDLQGEPMYWQQGMQQNPHRSTTPAAASYEYQRQQVKY